MILPSIGETPGDWRRHAACLGCAEGPELFYPSSGADARRLQDEAREKYCGRCPVVEECREYALARPENHGMWGGMCEKDLREERKRRRRAKKAS